MFRSLSLAHTVPRLFGTRTAERFDHNTRSTLWRRDAALAEWFNAARPQNRVLATALPRPTREPGDCQHRGGGQVGQLKSGGVNYPRVFDSQ